MPRVLVTAKAFAVCCPEASAPLTADGVEVRFAPQMGPLRAEQLLPLLTGVDVSIASSDAFTPAVIGAAPGLKGIVRWGVGVDSIDLEAASAHGVVVANVPGANTQSVADYTFGLLLNVARPFCEGRAALAGGEWRQQRGVEVWRKTLGIVGFGAIGRAVCRRAHGFEMRVLAHDPFVEVSAIRDEGAEAATLPRLLDESDFVTLHAMLTPQTRAMIDEGALRSMKPTAYLVNAGRGALVDEEALLQALTEGWIAGAAIDCYAEEPATGEHPLVRHPRCFATPHNAFNTDEVSERINGVIVEQVLDILHGRRPRFTVNPEVLE